MLCITSPILLSSPRVTIADTVQFQWRYYIIHTSRFDFPTFLTYITFNIYVHSLCLMACWSYIIGYFWFFNTNFFKALSCSHQQQIWAGRCKSQLYKMFATFNFYCYFRQLNSRKSYSLKTFTMDVHSRNLLVLLYMFLTVTNVAYGKKVENLVPKNNSQYCWPKWNVYYINLFHLTDSTKNFQFYEPKSNGLYV